MEGGKWFCKKVDFYKPLKYMNVKLIFNKIENIILLILAIIFAIMVTSLFSQVVLRYIFKSATPWAEELTRYAFIWMSMLGAAVAARRGRHMNVDYFVNIMPKSIRIIIIFLANILVIAFLIVATKYGIDLVIMTHKQLSSGMRIPMSYVYLSMPIGSILMILFMIESFLIKRNIKED